MKHIFKTMLLITLLAALLAACAPPDLESGGDAAEQPEAAQAEGTPEELTSSIWHLTNILNKAGDSVPALAGSEVTAIFGTEGNLTGSAGCNTYTANFTLKGENIVIGPAAATRKACPEPEGVMEQESLYLTNLSLVIGWQVEDENMSLTDGDGVALLTYAAAKEMADATLPSNTPPELAVEALANATYLSEWTSSGQAPLVDGEYSEAVVEGSATKTVVRLTERSAYLELEDGTPAAAVVLVTDPGGSGTFYDLAVVVGNNGEAENIASISLGDRVQINSVSIGADGVIAVDMITHGPDDPMCCPTQRVANTYVVQRGELTQASSTVLGMVESES